MSVAARTNAIVDLTSVDTVAWVHVRVNEHAEKCSVAAHTHFAPLLPYLQWSQVDT
jgi:hypothetical protein